MAFPTNWQNPIRVPAGQYQVNVDPLLLLPSRADLSQLRLDIQRMLMDSGIQRHTPIQVTWEGVIWDGHHAIRIAAERGPVLTVLVVNQKVTPSTSSILILPVGDPMQCPPEVSDVLVQIITAGLLRIRAFGWNGDAARCAVEADHLHNLPEVLREFRPELLNYYWHVERVSFCKSSSLPVRQTTSCTPW
jgi:hypothetical protein